MIPSDTGIRGLSGDRPVFIVPGRLLPIADNGREAGREEFSAGLVSGHDVLVRVVVRPRHRVTPQQQPPTHTHTAIARDQDRARPECRFIAISLSIQLITLN